MRVEILKEVDENILLEAVKEIQAKMKKKDNKITFENDMLKIKKKRKKDKKNR